MNTSIEYCFKIVIVGPSESGKSSLLKAFKSEPIPKNHISTIGVDYEYIRLNKKNIPYKLCFWDTAGSKLFATITKSYFQYSVLCLLVFDLTNPNSFSEIIQWYEEYKKLQPDNPIILIGNKLDKTQNYIINNTNNQNKQNITYGDIGKSIETFINTYNLPYIEVSAKNNINIQETIQYIINDMNVRILSKNIDPNTHKGISMTKISHGQHIPYHYNESEKQEKWYKKLF